MTTAMTISTFVQWMTMSDGRIYIISLSSTDGDRVLVRVLIENESGREETEFCLLREFAEKMNLEAGEIDSGEISEIEYFAEVTRAYFSACSSFAFTESSLKALERKLIQKGFDKNIACEAVEYLASRGFIDEAEIAKNRARVFLNKKWGRGRIFSKLNEEGFPKHAVECVRDELDKIDFAEICADLIKKKFGELPEDRREREKMYASLIRFGYSGSDIKAAMKIILEN